MKVMIGNILLILIIMSIILAGMMIHSIFSQTSKSRWTMVIIIFGAVLLGIILFLAFYAYGNSLINLP